MADNNTVLILYTTAGCHLCEQAAEMLDWLQQQCQVTVEAVDIASSEALVERYGIRIPVVQHKESGVELGWPFGPEELLNLGNS